MESILASFCILLRHRAPRRRVRFAVATNGTNGHEGAGQCCAVSGDWAKTLPLAQLMMDKRVEVFGIVKTVPVSCPLDAHFGPGSWLHCTATARCRLRFVH